MDLAQARPGEFAESQVAELRAKWPRTRFIYLLGAWCCGQKRVCEEFSAVPTVYAYENGSQGILDIALKEPGELAGTSKFVAPTNGMLLAVFLGILKIASRRRPDLIGSLDIKKLN